VNDPIGSSRQGTGNPMISHLVGEIETEQHGADPRPELGDLAITLEEDADIDCVLVNRPKATQMLDDGAVDLGDPRRMTRQEIVNSDARHADMRLVGRRELPITVRAYPTGHAADCAALTVAPDASDRDGSCFKSPGQGAQEKRRSQVRASLH
jgi:hypothetical protein